MGNKRNKTTRANVNRKIVGAIQKHLKQPVTFVGVTYTPAKLAKMFQEGIDFADASDAAKKIWHVAVARERAKTEELSNVQSLLRSHLSVLFGEASTEFFDFGFTPKAVKTVDVATKAEAVKKGAATRQARHTMGKRQKAKITGETSPPGTTLEAPNPTPIAPSAAGASQGTGIGSTAIAPANGATEPVKVAVA